MLKPAVLALSALFFAPVFAEEPAPQEVPKPAEKPKPGGNKGKGKAYLGVQMEAAEEGESGIIVKGVLPDSPAAAAGIREGDVLLEADGKPVGTPETLGGQIAEKAPGDAVKFRVRREGEEGKTEELELTATLARRPRQDRRGQGGGGEPTIEDVLKLLPPESQEAARKRVTDLQAKARILMAKIQEENPDLSQQEVQAKMQEQMGPELQGEMTRIQEEIQAVQGKK